MLLSLMKYLFIETSFQLYVHLKVQFIDGKNTLKVDFVCVCVARTFIILLS